MSDNESPLKIDVGAKLEIKTEVPAEASGRAVNALSDAISPLTEWLGMMGDRVRIHRRIVVNRLIKRAEEIIASEDRPAEPIPTKIAVPLLEHASQEEPTDDYMIEKWASLLAASTSPDAVSPRFVSLLSEINSRQARLLVRMHDIGNSKGIWNNYAAEHHFRLAIRASFLERHRDNPGYLASVASELGVFVVWAEMYLREKPNRGIGAHEFIKESTTQHDVDIAILHSLSLIETHRFHKDFPSFTIVVEYAVVTSLGRQFLEVVQRSTTSPAKGVRPTEWPAL